ACARRGRFYAREATSRRGRSLPASPAHSPPRKLKAGSNPRAPGPRCPLPDYLRAGSGEPTSIARASDRAQNTDFSRRLRSENSVIWLNAALIVRAAAAPPRRSPAQLGFKAAVRRLVEALLANGFGREGLVADAAGLV